MFQIVDLRLNDRVPPEELATSTDLELLHELSLKRKFNNTFVPGVGLVISVLGVTVDATLVTTGDGAMISELIAKVLVMSPQVGEIVTGKLILADSSGLLVSIGNIVPVRIPANQLRKTSVYDSKEKLWVWRYENFELFYDLEQPIRFRITNVDFKRENAPIRIEGSCIDDGLGLLAWWTG